MLAGLKSEARKLLSVRSTYFIVLISLAIVALFAGFGDGFRATAEQLRNPLQLASESANAVAFGGLILALAGLLLFGHEYRYNTIMYTLTSSNNRARSLLAKLLIVTGYAVVASTLLVFFSPLCAIIGTHLAGKHLSPQTFHVWTVWWHGVFCGWGYAMYAFILTAIIRSQIGAIVTFLMIPLIGENILSSIFKWIGKYLPYNSIQAVADTTNTTHMGLQAVSTAHSVTVSLAYIVIGLLVALALFVRRDAN